jgi:hypothetical protein
MRKFNLVICGKHDWVAVLKQTLYFAFHVFVWKRRHLDKNWSAGCKTFGWESWIAWRFWKTPQERDWSSYVRDSKHCIIAQQGLQTTTYSEKVRKSEMLTQLTVWNFMVNLTYGVMMRSRTCRKLAFFLGSLDSLKTSFLNSTALRWTSKIIQNDMSRWNIYWN